MKSTLKIISWSTGKAGMTAQKKAEIDAFYAKHDGKNIEVSFKVLPRRSNQLNRYLWGVVYPIVMEGLNDYGNEFDLEQTHEWAKLKFNAKEVIGDGGEVIGTIGGSTTDFNSDEFYNDYIEKIARFSAEELHREIPPPNSQSVLFAEYDEQNKLTLITPE